MVELTAENWDAYFELIEEFGFIENAFGEKSGLWIKHHYVLKDGYQAVPEETEIAIACYYEYNDKKYTVDYDAGTYTLGEHVSGPWNRTETTDAFIDLGDGKYGIKVTYGHYRESETEVIRECSNFKIERAQGTLTYIEAEQINKTASLVRSIFILPKVQYIFRRWFC